MLMSRPYLFLALFCGLALSNGGAKAQQVSSDTKKAVIFAYSRIGDSPDPEDSLPVETFKTHVLEISRANYRALALGDIVSALQSEENLPENTIALTFDAAGQDIYDTVWPLLKEYKLPFTIFIAPSMISEQKSAGMLSWGELKKLATDPLVTIGLHPDIYANMALWDETTARTHINNAKAIVRDRLGLEPDFFSYPYGLLNNAAKAVVQQSGFKAAFGQQSGAAYNGSNLTLLPRFTMNPDFGSLNRFIMTAESLPLPVSDIEPETLTIGSQTQELALGFTLKEPLQKEEEKLSCYSNTIEKPTINHIGNNRIEIRLLLDSAPQKLRINCTLPASKDPETSNQRWRWLGFVFHVEHGIEDAILEQ